MKQLIIAFCFTLIALPALAGVAVEFTVNTGTVDNWQVAWGPSATDMPNSYDLGAVTSVEDLDGLLGLAPGTKYYFQFTPQLSGHESVPSDIYGVTIPTKPQVIELDPVSGGVTINITVQ